MIAVTDVWYPDGALHVDGACAVIGSWSDGVALETRTVRLPGSAAPYQPGQFYMRELPALEAVLATITTRIELVVVDGYVWLGPGRPGLGMHLYEALNRAVPVIGVAKTRFTSAPSTEVLRGGSRQPLYVTAEGVAATDAATWVASMHGPHRLPTIVTLADHLGRGMVAPAGVVGAG